MRKDTEKQGYVQLARFATLVVEDLSEPLFRQEELLITMPQVYRQAQT